MLAAFHMALSSVIFLQQLTNTNLVGTKYKYTLKNKNQNHTQ